MGLRLCEDGRKLPFWGDADKEVFEQTVRVCGHIVRTARGFFRCELYIRKSANHLGTISRGHRDDVLQRSLIRLPSCTVTIGNLHLYSP